MSLHGTHYFLSYIYSYLFLDIWFFRNISNSKRFNHPKNSSSKTDSPKNNHETFNVKRVDSKKIAVEKNYSNTKSTKHNPNFATIILEILNEVKSEVINHSDPQNPKYLLKDITSTQYALEMFDEIIQKTAILEKKAGLNSDYAACSNKTLMIMRSLENYFYTYIEDGEEEAKEYKKSNC